MRSIAWKSKSRIATVRWAQRTIREVSGWTSSTAIKSIELKINQSLSTLPDQTRNSTVCLEDAEYEEERGSRPTESWESGDQLQASEGASSEPAARGVPDGEKQNGRSDPDVSVAALEDRVPAATPMIVPGSDEVDDSDEQEEPEMSVVGSLNLQFEDEYKLMNQEGEDESSVPDEAIGDDTLNEDLNGNLFFEEEYRRLSSVN